MEFAMSHIYIKHNFQPKCSLSRPEYRQKKVTKYQIKSMMPLKQQNCFTNYFHIPTNKKFHYFNYFLCKNNILEKQNCIWQTCLGHTKREQNNNNYRSKISINLVQCQTLVGKIFGAIHFVHNGKTVSVFCMKIEFSYSGTRIVCKSPGTMK